MAKNNDSPAPTAKAPSKFKISKSILQKLPAAERADAEEVLWTKSAGLCALCGEALDDKPELNVADHRVPESVDPEGTKVQNLYLAHLSCNASRKDLPFDIARPIVSFRVYSEKKAAVKFSDVLGKYVINPNQPVTVKKVGSTITLSSGEWLASASISVDPATGTEYFFAEIPFTLVLNDAEIQPRLISYSHVRKLALDFVDRPVHEPGNCRLVMHGQEAGKLLQFDGQHKSTAQILLGRNSGSFKVYINPEIAMLQKLVIKIQQEIKKQPLTRSETLAKLGDVLGRLLDEYDASPRTEVGFSESQSKKTDKAEVKKLYVGELKSLAFFDEDNELALAVKSANRPTTDAIIIDRIIGPLLHKDLLDIDMDAEGGRDIERANIVNVLNRISSKMLPAGWHTDPLRKKRAETFFLGGAINWWMNEILVPALRWVLMKMKDSDPLLLEPLDTDAESRVMACIDLLCGWEVWSTTDEAKLAALRSNTLKNVTAAFPEHTSARLIKEMASS